MNDFEQQLKQRLSQDAQAYRDQVTDRFDAQAFESRLDSNLNQGRRGFWLPVSLAACLALVAVLWMGLRTPQIVPQNTDVAAMASQVEQWPLAIENMTQSPLQKEQEAIIADLKNLKAQFLSI